MNDMPGFHRLGIETLYSADEWRKAWLLLGEPQLWAILLELNEKVGVPPTVAAQQLAAAYETQ